ncbi:MAG: hypothetical protein SGCHY_000370 [Lobulomycetales sp.]
MTLDRAAPDAEYSRDRRGQKETVMDLLESQPEKFSMILEIIERSSNLKDRLGDAKAKVTFFAPSNDALTKFHKLVRSNEQQGRRHSTVPLPSMDEIVQYHTCSELISFENLVDGQLVKSSLRESSLDGCQYITVSQRLGGTYLNMFSKIESANLRAGNGYVHSLDWVLLPPVDALHVAFSIPMVCSTWTAAAKHCGMEKDVTRENGQTVLVPTNSAWQQLNMTDLFYLFSPLGEADLKKILQYHVSNEISYGPEVIKQKKQFTIPTILGEDIQVNVLSRKNPDSWGRRGQPTMPDSMIILNSGEASIKAADILTSNGNIHLINAVLIPSSVVLPSRRFPGGRRSVFDDELVGF